MSNEEALEQLKINGTKEPLEISGSPTRMADYFKALDIASKALEKQIAKKPICEGDGYSDGNLVYDEWICPNCNNRYEVDYDNYDYCPNCGQKLDRSDIE